MSQVQIFDYAGPNLGYVEPMQVDVGMEEVEVVQHNRRMVENPTLDLEQISCSYKGLAKIYRLFHIADHCFTLRYEALRLALSYSLTTCNTQLYQNIHKRLSDALSSTVAPTSSNNTQQRSLPDTVASTGGGTNALPPLDTLWLEITMKKAALKLEKLDIDLKNYKTNSIKESVRRGHDDLGDHYLECGDLSNALKCYSRARDYCTSSKQLVNMCLNVIKVSIYLQNWSHVISYVSKAENTPYFTESNKDNIQAIVTKLKVSAGVAELVGGRYREAAKSFLQANYDYVDFPELLSSNSIATYGCLCALATFDRQELHKLVITSSTFKLFLELEPQLRDIVNHFYQSQYDKCLNLLNLIKDNLFLDLYLSSHVDRLYALIRSKALCQYFGPYKSADMTKMATAFNTTPYLLEDEVMQLILEEKINARIDSHNKVLYVKDVNQRNLTFEKSLELGEEFQRKTKALILRAAVVNSQLQVKSTVREGNNQPVEMSANASSAVSYRI